MSARDAMPFDAAPTTRRYPRTMHGNEAAWPNSPEYACSLTRPPVGPGGEWWLYALCAVAAIAASAAGYGRVGWAAVLLGAAVACWRMARSER